MLPFLTIAGWRMPVYGLFSAAGLLTAVFWLKARREKFGLSENAFWAAVWCLFLGAVVGAKGLFVALAWELYASGQFSLWRNFDVGFVFFGGLLGATGAGLVFARVKKVSFRRGADYVAVALPLGHAVGRLGCLAAGCCRGRPTTLPWGVWIGGLRLHPVQLYEAAGLAAIAWFCRLLLGVVEKDRLPEGRAFAAYLALYGLLRLLMDFFRGDGRLERFLGLSHQQGFALACLAAAACLYKMELKHGA